MAANLDGQARLRNSKRVSFARALITDETVNANSKPLLLFDEPTAGLDPIASTRIEDLINKINDKANGSSIVVSHVLSTIERTSEKVLMLYGGKSVSYTHLTLPTTDRV